MRLIQVFRTAYSNLKMNRSRTFLTVAGISVGIGAIVFLVSLGYGLQLLTTKRIASIEAINTLDIGAAKKGPAKLDNPTISEFEKIDKVEKVSPVLSIGAKATLADAKTDVVIMAVTDAFFGMEGIKPIYGGLFSNTTTEIVISTAAVKALKKTNEEILNQTLILKIGLPTETGKGVNEKEANFKVLGIVLDDASSFAYLPISTIKNDLPSNIIYNSAKVKIKSREDLNNVRSKIEGMGFAVTSIADTISQVDKTFKIIQLILALFGAIALLVSSIGMFNTMTIALLERTRDIGIMKAIGVRNRDVYRIFLVESSLISLVGGIIGVITGILTSKIINLLVNLLAKSVGGEPQKLFATPLWFAFAIVGFALLVGILTGFYPSRRASKINPLDALRYE